MSSESDSSRSSPSPTKIWSDRKICSLGETSGRCISFLQGVSAWKCRYLERFRNLDYLEHELDLLNKAEQSPCTWSSLKTAPLYCNTLSIL